MSTESEREALARLIEDGFEQPDENYATADRILAAGFRRSEVPEPSGREAKIHGELVTMRVDEWRRITDELARLRTLEGSLEPSAHDDACEADWGAEGQESPCRCAERAQGEPSDAQVEAAAQAMFEPDGPGGDYTWAEMVVEDPSRADIWREDARKVLRAAGGAR